MLTRFNGSGMVAVLPERPFATLALVILLAGATGNQLNGRWNGVGLTIVFHQQMNMIRGDRIVQDLQENRLRVSSNQATKRERS